MKKKIKDTFQYLLGNFRYWAYHTKKFKFLIRKHIQEQYEFRLKLMKPECYQKGSCISCGCVVPNLQFADKSCEEHCYPKMMSKLDWEMFVTGVIKYKDERGIWHLKKKILTGNFTANETSYHLFLNGKLKNRLYGKIF